MRTIEINLYQYDELNKEAKQYAIEHLREQCYISNAEWTWEDANQTIDKVKEVAGIWCDIDESSQGWYVNSAHETNTDFYDDRDDEVKFAEFLQRYRDQYKEMLWCDNSMLNIVQTYQYDERRSYASNVAWMIVKFCRIISDECLLYFHDDNVEEWILVQEFEFTEDGRLYNH